MIQDTVDIFAIHNPKTVNTNETVPISVIVVYVSVDDQIVFTTSGAVEGYCQDEDLL